MIDNRAERRRSPLLSCPRQRRAPLLSAEESILHRYNSSSPTDTNTAKNNNNSAKRRKCLLNTPLLEEPTPAVAQAEESLHFSSANMCLTCRNKLRLNERGEYTCFTCGKVQSLSTRRSLIEDAVMRQRPKFDGSSLPDAIEFDFRKYIDVNYSKKVSPLFDVAPFDNNTSYSRSHTSSIIPQSSHAPSLLGNGNCAPASLFSTNVTSGNRRVLLPSSPSKIGDEKTTASPLFTAASCRPLNGQKKIEQDRQHYTYLLETPPRLETQISSMQKQMTDKSTSTDWAVNDLAWLNDQRAAIDKRIAELQKNAELQYGDAKKRSDPVIYVNGYFCRTCRQFLRGDYNAKTVHCQEEAHVANMDECTSESALTDPELALKYFEERYDGMAFDDGEDEDNNICKSTILPRSDDLATTVNAPSTLRKAPSIASSFRESDAETRDDATREQSSSDEEEEEEDGTASSRRRFDRTRIFR